MLSSLVISTADLQASMLGRTVNRLAKDSPHAEVARMAGNLVKKWREEVSRAKARKDGAGGRSGGGRQPRSPPRVAPLAVLRENSASLDAELGSFAFAGGALRRRASGCSSAPVATAPVAHTQRDHWRAAFQRCLESGGGGSAAARLAVRGLSHCPVRLRSEHEADNTLCATRPCPTQAGLEAAVFASAGARFVAAAETLHAALGSNASLRAALLSGWLPPPNAAALTGCALMSTDFLADM
jgi:hypothetical protein